MAAAIARDASDTLAALRELALDLRWTWNHEADALWQRIDPETWERTRNPWAILLNVSPARLDALSANPSFLAELDGVIAARRVYLDRPDWFSSTYGAAALGGVAYFSMEFGLSDALPLYAGGLGILAGDLLKTASDLGIPLVGIGLLFQEGYFRQRIDGAGWQHEANPHNDPATMPIRPVLEESGVGLRIGLELPGRTLYLRIWQASVGRATLYLLDSNDPLNTAVDRGITSKLYEDGAEIRLLQEIVLGVGGWRVVARLRPEIEVCHINEGHAALVAIERARDLAERSGMSFAESWPAVRAGTVFTTHTAVASGYDRYPAELVARYLRALLKRRDEAEPAVTEILALGSAAEKDEGEPFNMAYLAVRSSLRSFAVSRLHERVSRHIFQPLFPRWPLCQVPVDHITNGVHVPSWDSAEADAIWTATCGKDRWLGMPDELCKLIETASDEQLWAMRNKNRSELIDSVRARLAVQLGTRGLPAASVAQASSVLDPNILTLGFARRFTEYKRPDLLLHDPARLGRLLTDGRCPVQIVVAGKAHPKDDEGKRMIQTWIVFAQRPEYRSHVVFLEDYDIALAQELVQGVDVWVNTPRRPWEACGTSGMKILANGGLNVSELDGWWEEAYGAELGWAIDGPRHRRPEETDAVDAEELYAALEREVVPEFYDRDHEGMPRRWLARLRRSMAALSPQYCSTRMVREYVTRAYLPAVRGMRARLADTAKMAKSIACWERRVRRTWQSVHIGTPRIERSSAALSFSVPINLGEMAPDDVRIELYAEPVNGGAAEIIALTRGERPVDMASGYLYVGSVRTSRPAEHFTVRVIPHHPGVQVPAELALVLWQR